MNGSADDAAAVSRYLRALRRALAPLPEADRAEIVAEIESHLAEAGGPPAAALDRLGPADALARSYLEDHQLSHAMYGGAPGALLATLLARATRSGAAFAAGAAGVVLYAFALSLAAVAVIKPVAPGHVGYWEGAGQMMFGLVSAPPPGAPERLGWWIVPIALAGAVGCYLLATGLMRWCGRRLLRRDGPIPG